MNVINLGEVRVWVFEPIGDHVDVSPIHAINRVKTPVDLAQPVRALLGKLEAPAGKPYDLDTVPNETITPVIPIIIEGVPIHAVPKELVLKDHPKGR